MIGIELVDLQSDDAVRVDLVGAKAARLAQARRRGLPVLPGLIVPARCGRPIVAAVLAVLHEAGPHAAQLAAMAQVEGAVSFDGLVEAVGRLGGTLVARSSAIGEDDPRWSGAYSSFLELQPAEVPTAVAACWASALREEVVFRCEVEGITPVEACPAVLIQPYVAPSLSGLATTVPGGRVEVVAVEGSPAPLLSGWVSGLHAVVEDGRSRGPAEDLVPAAVLAEIAALALQGGAGAPVAVEWAVVDGRVVLLQIGRSAPGQSHPVPAADSGPGLHEPTLASVSVGGEAGGEAGEAADERRRRTLALARLVARYAGPLGEQLILAWHLAGIGARGGEDRSGAVDGPAIGNEADAVGRFELAARRSAMLTSTTWSLPVPSARKRAAEVLTLLATGETGEVLDVLQGLAPADPRSAALILDLLASVSDAMVAAGLLASAEQIWGLDVDQVSVLVESGEPVAWHRQRWRTLRWQPFLQSVVRRYGEPRHGPTASPGAAAGLARRVGLPAEIRSVVPGEIVVLENPHPRYAPLLWVAGGLVTEAGSSAAHLMEVARSLRVPALAGVGPLELDPSGGDLLCVDGDAGTLTIAMAR